MIPEDDIHPDDLDRFARVRASRVRSERARDMGETFAAQAVFLKRARRKHAGCAGAWEAVCPPELIGRTSIVGVRAGVLTIGVSDHPTKYRLDRLLRSGAGDELIRLAPTTVHRVKLTVDAGLGRPGGA